MKWLWLAVLALPAVLEIYTIASPAEGDMLSEIVIPLLMQSPLLWGATLAAYTAGAAWLLFHWWFQYRKKE